jgi:hypothetical protein
MIDLTIGLEDIEVHEDGEEAYALLLVREVSGDERERTIEATAGLMTFRTLETGEWVRAGVKVKQLDRQDSD